MRAFPRKFGYRVIAEIETNKLGIDIERARQKRAVDSLVDIG
jgi:DNA helicase-2/ATP-dependent DNA helicase PcrA